MKGQYIFVILIICLCSCTKDKVQQYVDTVEGSEVEDTCGCVPFSSGGNVPDMYISDSISYASPNFNPNNDNEIIFIDEGVVPNRIYKYNLLTNAKTFVFEGSFGGHDISWSKDDWILFTLMDFNIWKIRSDGTQLTQVTSNGAFFHPEWNSEGDRFIAYHAYYEDGDKGKIFNQAGTIVDSFTYSPPGPNANKVDWTHPSGLIGFHSAVSLRVKNVYTNSVISYYYNSNNEKSMHDFTWVSESEAIVIRRRGLYKYNIYTKEFTKLLCSCPDKYYRAGFANSNKTKILFMRIEPERIDNATIKTKSKIVMMNIDGTNEHVVEIP